MVAAALLFSACDSDRDYNPVLDPSTAPTTFKLNTPAYSTQGINLEKSSSLHFTWSQPAYGFPAVTTYTLQMSLTNTWDPAQYDEQGNETAAATCYTLSTSTSQVTADVDAKDFDKGVAMLSEWSDESSVSDTAITAYVRCLASAGGTQSVSNVVAIKVLPYYMSVVDYPHPWWFTGAGIQGGWNSGYADCVPFDLTADGEYDKNTGAGVYTKTLWLKGGGDYGFKMVSILTNWDYQIGGTFDAPDYFNGGASNFTAPADGWYTFSIESKGLTEKPVLKITATTVDNEVLHTNMYVTGTALNNEKVEMSPMLVNGHNHVWHATINTVKGGLTFVDENGKVYSSNKFPTGFATSENGVIPAVKGTLEVYYDDLSGCYEFFAN